MPFDANEFFDNLEQPENSHEEQSLGTGIEEQSEQEQETTEYDEQEINEQNSQEEQSVEQEGTSRKLAGIYNSVEDLEEGYKNLQREYTRLKQQFVDDITKQIPDNQQQHQVTLQQNNPVIPPELMNNPQFIQLAQTNPQQAMAVVVEYTRRQAIQQYQQTTQQETKKMQSQIELLMLRSTTPDFDQVAPYMVNTLKDNPWLWDTERPMQAAYKLAKASMIEEGLQQASTTVAQQAQQKTQAKKGAVAEKQSAKTPPKQKSPEDEIVESILSAGGSRNSVFF